jgi:hypothetical protein
MTPQPAVTYDPLRKRWSLEQVFRVELEREVFAIVPPFEFDLASIPRPLWALLASHELGIRAPLVHDWLYRNGGRVGRREFSRAQADRFFLRHMKEDGVGRLRRSLAYAAVRVFGAGSWKETF